MILQVHDELNFSVLPEEKDKVQKIVIEEMEMPTVCKYLYTQTAVGEATGLKRIKAYINQLLAR